MTRDRSLEAQVQSVLNEMLDEQLLPFTLNVGKIMREQHYYTVFFYDSRLRSVDVPLYSDQMLCDSVRKSVMDSVSRLSGPFTISPELRNKLASRLMLHPRQQPIAVH